MLQSRSSHYTIEDPIILSKIEIAYQNAYQNFKSEIL